MSAAGVAVSGVQRWAGGQTRAQDPVDLDGSVIGSLWMHVRLGGWRVARGRCEVGGRGASHHAHSARDATTQIMVNIAHILGPDRTELSRGGVSRDRSRTLHDSRDT